MLEEVKVLLAQMNQQNVRQMRRDPDTVVFYEEIKLKMEEQNEKFVSDTKEKNIEIKMEVPTAPEEEQITPNIIIQNISETKIPSVNTKTEIIESKELTTEDSTINEIKSEIDELDTPDSYVEKETSQMEQYQRINAHNDRVMAKWYARCATAGIIPS